MIEDWIESTTRLANARLSKKYPLMGEPIKEWMTQYILEALYDIVNKFEEEK